LRCFRGREQYRAGILLAVPEEGNSTRAGILLAATRGGEQYKESSVVGVSRRGGGSPESEDEDEDSVPLGPLSLERSSVAKRDIERGALLGVSEEGVGASEGGLAQRNRGMKMKTAFHLGPFLKRRDSTREGAVVGV